MSAIIRVAEPSSRYAYRPSVSRIIYIFRILTILDAFETIVIGQTPPVRTADRPYSLPHQLVFRIFPWSLTKDTMLQLAIILLLLWVLAVVVLHILFPLIHLLLVVAVIVWLVRFIRGKKPVAQSHEYPHE